MVQKSTTIKKDKLLRGLQEAVVLLNTASTVNGK